MHPELVHALATERQRSLLMDAQRASIARRDARPSRRPSTHRRSAPMARLGIALRHRTV